jgi:hypothetical protein
MIAYHRTSVDFSGAMLGEIGVIAHGGRTEPVSQIWIGSADRRTGGVGAQFIASHDGSRKGMINYAPTGKVPRPRGIPQAQEVWTCSRPEELLGSTLASQMHWATRPLVASRPRGGTGILPVILMDRLEACPTARPGHPTVCSACHACQLFLNLETVSNHLFSPFDPVVHPLMSRGIIIRW